MCFYACSPITSNGTCAKRSRRSCSTTTTAPQAERASPVAQAQISAAARRKAATKHTDAGEPIASFRSLLRHLATLTRNTVRLARDHTAILYSAATPLQRRAFEPLALPLPA
jgi:hypothetical protein